MTEEAILLFMLSMAGLVVLGIIVLCMLAGRMLLHIAKMIDKLGGWE